MRIKVIGKAHLKGTSKKTGNPYDFIQVHYNAPAKSVFGEGAMTLSLDQGAVIDATTGENGVGHITVRNDTSEVALIFILTGDGTLQCALWLERTVPPNTDHPQKVA